MASRQTATLNIAQNGTDSNVLEIRNARSVTIIAPATLTGVVTVRTGTDAAGTGAVDVQSPPGTDVTVAANKATVLTAVPFPSIQLHSNLNEASARTFTIIVELGE